MGDGKLSELGLSLTTQLIGVVLTVFLVDYLLQRMEKKKQRPRKFVIYIEICVLFNRLVGLYYKLYSESVVEPSPVSFVEFLREGCIEKALSYSDIRKEPLVAPKTTMINYIYNEIIQLERRYDRIMAQYGAFVPPELGLFLHNLFRDSPYFSFLKHIQFNFKSRKNLPYPKTLLYFMGPPDDGFKEELIKLYHWLLREKKQLMKHYPELISPSEPTYCGNPKHKRHLRYRISEDEREKQEIEYNEWSNRRRNK